MTITETGEEAFTAMVAQWMREREGAPDAFAELRGVVMLAETNEQVNRINDAAQAVRRAQGELGRSRTYAVAGGRDLHLAEGDLVLIKVNDRETRAEEGGSAVLNGYRGVVRSIDEDGRALVEWEQDGDAGLERHSRKLKPGYIANDGVERLCHHRGESREADNMG